MFDEDETPGLTFEDPWEEFRARWCFNAFVDDTTQQGILDSSGTLSIDELVEQIRQEEQMWETLLHTSGGCLNLAKCSWTLQY
jgi:hypothetical protein